MNGQVILVTGASSGIGALCAQELAGSGAIVHAASRRATAPPGCQALAMDVDRDDSVSAGVAAVLAAQGRLDALVLCAGWGLAGAIEDSSAAEGQAQFETNFFGVHRVIRAALPALRASGGRIVIVSSLMAQLPVPYQAFYGASKAALSSYAEALSLELAPCGIAVVTIEPGNFRTGFTASRRRAQGWTADSPHDVRCTASIDWMEQDEARAPEPQRVVEAIRQALCARRPPLRQVVAASALERFSTTLRALLPARLYHAIALRVFRVL